MNYTLLRYELHAKTVHNEYIQFEEFEVKYTPLYHSLLHKHIYHFQIFSLPSYVLILLLVFW